MAKIRITADELSNFIYDKLIEGDVCPRGFPIAVIPDKSTPAGWAIVSTSRNRERYPECAARIEAVQKELRALYVLRR
jgi:L-amino acid N-acyltransferase YncA